jgi:SRSO17 transposase
VASRFVDFYQRYSGHFVQQGMNSVGHARHYLSGLLGTQRRKNIETIHNDVADSDYQGMEQFISSSPWCHRALMDQVATDADALLGDPGETGLFLDESSFLKKGKASVGVQRQWSGRAGKVENCQVGVFACLGRDQHMALTDFRLYLPESWAADSERCARAKIPQEHRIYEPKWRQALDMVRHARQLGLHYGWVGADSLYGSNAAFLNELEDMGEKFMADINKTTKVWTSAPMLEAPVCAKGRPRKHPRLHSANTALYLSVESLVSECFESAHRILSYRQGQKGKLTTRFWACPVWCWEKGWAKPRERLLVVRRDADEAFKYSLTNLRCGESWERLAWIQGQRYWIEHAFHEAKSQIGMAQYQVRVWKGWHHHISLACLALLFTIKTRLETRHEIPLLSTRDITELLDFYLPRRGLTEAEVIAQIHHRHRQRQQDLDRRRDNRPGLPDLTK